MTILTMPSIHINKPDCIKTPLVVDNYPGCDEDKVDIFPQETPAHYQWTRAQDKRLASTLALICMSLVAMLVVAAGISCGLILYRSYLRTNNVRHYQRFCSIPMEPVQYKNDMMQAEQLIEPNYREPRVLQWSSQPQPDVQVFSFGDEQSDEAASALREEFILGGKLETIRVFDNGRTITFLNDFEDNVTGIVDQDRCFMMDLNPSLVLAPELLVLGIENEQDFDISRVHSTLRAVLPAIRELGRRARRLAQRCAERPLYQLRAEPVDDRPATIRKRAADAPSHDYIQFAGKHVQEIEISNLAELLQHEQDQRN